MGHMIEESGVHARLQKRLDQNLIGAPKTRAMMELLKLRFDEEEAAVAARLPFQPAPLGVLARKLKMDPGHLEKLLERMAFKGLVFDLDVDGARYYFSAPTVIGFFELTFMRVHDDDPGDELARLLKRIEKEDPSFARSAFPEGTLTQVGRVLAHETALPEGDHSCILDHDRVTSLISEESSFSIGTCYCRHKQEHAGEACNNPQQMCLSMGESAEYLIRRRMARRAERSEVLDVLQQARDLGMVHIGDNVQRRLTYICNCCSCCCGQIGAITVWGLNHAVVSSNFVAVCGTEACTGCSLCARRCPIEAITMVPPSGEGKPQAKVDESFCFGCGVCVTVCRFGAMRLDPRPQRVFTPESTISRILHMALERGKLPELLLPYHPTSRSQQWMVGLLRALMNLPPAKRLLLNERVKSTFVRRLVGFVTRFNKDVAEMYG
jgi:ferredoxin